MSALPEFPKPTITQTRYFSFEQMREYGALCRNQAKEEAAKACSAILTPFTDVRCQNAFVAARLQCEIEIGKLPK